MEETARNIYKKLPVILLFIFVLFLVAFGTWELFQGNLEAAFSTLPFLFIIYLFVVSRRS
jgi:TRAP-type C4-dicarboxylate transport system permease small subunit